MWLPLNRLQRKVLVVILTIVVVPMLGAGMITAQWISSRFEHRLEQWIIEAAHVDRIWLKGYQNDAVMLGRGLAESARYKEALAHGHATPPKPWLRISRRLGLRLIQVFGPHGRLLYSSSSLRIAGYWNPAKHQAVLRVIDRHRDILAAVGVTAVTVPQRGVYHIVLGGLLNRHFIKELSQITGLDTKLYYRAGGTRYLDVLSQPDHAIALTGLSQGTMRRLLSRRSDYDVHADTDRFRGLYTPIADSSGHVEALVFNGLKRGGVDAFIANRGALFLAISIAGILIGGLTGLLLSRIVIRPVEHLRNAVMSLAGQDFDAKVPVYADDELGDLGRAFNAMALRLREARDEQQQRSREDKLVALGKLSAALAHEIRNPIGVISAAAILLDKPGQEETKQTELKRMIREESARVAALTGDFLKLSRNRPPAVSILDPREPLKRALAGVLAVHPDIQVTETLLHGSARIMADGELLQQAFTNLLTNAAEACVGKTGRIVLSSAVVNDQMVLEIEDNGAGIDAGIMPRLFEPFFTTKTHGTGLGLSIAAALVEANGGTLTAEARDQGGARFVMRFPILRSNPQTMPDADGHIS
ncbi:MAG TPA: HAMP domain-containing sensor histidine kinase [Acidiferrobacter sp.]|nr:HAMP domain-containing sensor histidine kinase [Acidiferrobacter sp.]